VVHHFDHLLLLDRQQWQQLRPDVVLQLGGHLTSKRTNQFLEWCCLEAGNSNGSGDSQQEQQQQPLQWIHVDRSPKRHDQLHLLAHRLQAPLPLLVAALAQQLGAGGASGSTANASSAREEQRRYCRLLQLLDREASSAVDAALEKMTELTEPQVARTLSQQLPPGKPPPACLPALHRCLQS
jgi:isochorismate synthase/2-succinyl-5-enolpyruvyl-6-hydroxy-3-cyclohexene-1-carboxylate synthase/2-succinyl-6-hydroxy-2,4-cyclohexadiene-1-carboxylate synthase/O-succinylbenzoate synthase